MLSPDESEVNYFQTRPKSSLFGIDIQSSGSWAQCDTWHWGISVSPNMDGEILTGDWDSHDKPSLAFKWKSERETNNGKHQEHLPVNHRHFLRFSFTNWRQEIALSWAGEIFLLVVGKTSEAQPVVTQLKY